MKYRSLRRLAVIPCMSVLAASGCTSGLERAADDHAQISVGMTRDEVQAKLGPARVRAYSDGEEWHYSYAATPSMRRIAVGTGYALAVVAVVGGFVVILMMASAGRSESLPWNFSGGPLFGGQPHLGTADRGHFRVYFDRAGTVRGVSPLEICEDP